MFLTVGIQTSNPQHARPKLLQRLEFETQHSECKANALAHVSDSNPQPSASKVNALTDCANTMTEDHVVKSILKKISKSTWIGFYLTY